MSKNYSRNVISNQLSVPSVSVPDGATSTDAVLRSTDEGFQMTFDRQDVHMAVIPQLTDSILISQITDLSLLPLLFYSMKGTHVTAKSSKTNKDVVLSLLGDNVWKISLFLPF